MNPCLPSYAAIIWDLAPSAGSLTPAVLETEIKAIWARFRPISKRISSSIRKCETFVLDPAQDEFRKAAAKTSKLFPIWSALPEESRNHAL